jgi:hypothetical protein
MIKTSSPAVAFERTRSTGKDITFRRARPALFLACAHDAMAPNSDRGEFNGLPDEAAHYLTGSLVRDYAAAGSQPPFASRKDYYLHYRRSL